MKIKKERLIPAGILVIIGGKENKGETKAPNRENPDGFVSRDVLRIFSDLSKKKNSSIEVITSGSAKGSETFADYKKVFGELGHRKVGHIHHNTREEVLKDDLEARINSADAIFFA